MTEHQARVVARVAELWRFPVKSMRGERVTATALSAKGVPGDRFWALRDLHKGELTSAKHLPKLLSFRATYLRDDFSEVDLEFPNGEHVTSKDRDISTRLSDVLKHPVKLLSLREVTDKRQFRLARFRGPKDLRRLLGVKKGGPLPDLAQLPLSMLAALAVYATPPGTFFDAYPLHLISSNSMAALAGECDATGVCSERFRPNLVLEVADASGYPELAWLGARLLVGQAELEICAGTFRCGMPAHAQSAALPKAPSIVRGVYDKLGSVFGVYARVIRPGAVAIGDQVVLARDTELSFRSAVDRIGTSVKRGILEAYLSF